MKMVKTYQGFFRNGKFVPLEEVTIPENVEVYVMVTEREVISEMPSKTPEVTKETLAREQEVCAAPIIWKNRPPDQKDFANKLFTRLP